MRNIANTLIKHIPSQVGGFCTNIVLYGFDSACYYSPSNFARRVTRAEFIEPETEKSTTEFSLSRTLKNITIDFWALTFANAMMDKLSKEIATQLSPLNSIQDSSLRSAMIGCWYRYYNGKDVMSIREIIQDLMTGAERALFIGMSTQMLNQLLGDPTEERIDPAILALGGVMGECLLSGYNRITKPIKNKAADNPIITPLTSLKSPTR